MKALTGPECYQTGIFIRQAPDVLPYKSAIHPKQISGQQTYKAREESVTRKTDKRRGWGRQKESAVSGKSEGENG